MTDAEQADQLRKLAIIPAYNEEGMVGQVVRGIRRHAPEFDIVVDDGSTDRTFAEASAEGVTVIRHPFNLGIGGAMQSGFKYAAANDTTSPRRSAAWQHKPRPQRPARGAAREAARPWCAGADSAGDRYRCRSAAGSET